MTMFLAMAIASSALLALGVRAASRWEENEKSLREGTAEKASWVVFLVGAGREGSGVLCWVLNGLFRGLTIV
jgi:hypothetical protein